MVYKSPFAPGIELTLERSNAISLNATLKSIVMEIPVAPKPFVNNSRHSCTALVGFVPTDGVWSTPQTPRVAVSPEKEIATSTPVPEIFVKALAKLPFGSQSNWEGPEGVVLQSISPCIVDAPHETGRCN
jgi:hypothetical protein